MTGIYFFFFWFFFHNSGEHWTGVGETNDCRTTIANHVDFMLRHNTVYECCRDNRIVLSFITNSTWQTKMMYTTVTGEVVRDLW